MRESERDVYIMAFSQDGYYNSRRDVPPSAINTSPPNSTEPSSHQNPARPSGNPFYMALDRPTTYNDVYSNNNATEPAAAQQQTSPDQKTAFYLFFNCQTTGSNIHRDRIVEVAVQCWPYVENAPTFNSKVDHGQKRRGRRKNAKGTFTILRLAI